MVIAPFWGRKHFVKCSMILIANFYFTKIILPTNLSFYDGENLFANFLTGVTCNWGLFERSIRKLQRILDNFTSLFFGKIWVNRKKLISAMLEAPKRLEKSKVKVPGAHMRKFFSIFVIFKKFVFLWYEYLALNFQKSARYRKKNSWQLKFQIRGGVTWYFQKVKFRWNYSRKLKMFFWNYFHNKFYF